ncbi:hypothetical protein ACFV0O_34515 [Kitasatospora sp. NPDC059577]|uniref:hypothetical protein n=1 Tax=Kitasatospora sp. NPDC059577 TaxID=3346873 RepID=UPI00369C1262
MMFDLLQAGADSVQHVAHGAGHILADNTPAPKFDVDPGTGSAPPGAEKLKTVLQWVAWVVFALCVCGILLTAGKMAVSHSRGQGGEHASSLAWVLAACILGGAASGLVGMLI